MSNWYTAFSSLPEMKLFRLARLLNIHIAGLNQVSLPSYWYPQGLYTLPSPLLLVLWNMSRARVILQLFHHFGLSAPHPSLLRDDRVINNVKPWWSFPFEMYSSGTLGDYM